MLMFWAIVTWEGVNKKSKQYFLNRMRLKNVTMGICMFLIGKATPVHANLEEMWKESTIISLS